MSTRRWCFGKLKFKSFVLTLHQSISISYILYINLIKWTLVIFISFSFFITNIISQVGA